VLYGKKQHAEVIGIIGQTAVNVMVVEGVKDLEQLDFTRPVTFLSQTTRQAEDFHNIGNLIRQRMSSYFKEDAIPFTIVDSTCNHVKRRANHLKEFARKFETIIFISGKNSSNGKILFEVCKDGNLQTHWIDNLDEIDKRWFEHGSTVGICGATSTPRWQLEEASDKIRSLMTDY
jgi:4-hydroxy-3-methylbut-2-enyl diphosphate reductase